MARERLGRRPPREGLAQSRISVAFLTAGYARRIIGWRTETSMGTKLVLNAIDQRDPRRWGSQFTAMTAVANTGRSR